MTGRSLIASEKLIALLVFKPTGAATEEKLFFNYTSALPKKAKGIATPDPTGWLPLDFINDLFGFVIIFRGYGRSYLLLKATIIPPNFDNKKINKNKKLRVLKTTQLNSTRLFPNYLGSAI